MKKTIVLIIMLACSTMLMAQRESKRVLFIGNSYTYVNDLPQLLWRVAESAGDAVEYQSNTPGGCTFQQHCTNQSMNLIQQGGWDVVVLQEQSQLPSFPQSQVEVEVFPYAQQLVNAVYTFNPEGEAMFYMTWGRKYGDQQNAQFFPVLGTYEGMDSMLYERYLYMAREYDASVCPVGRVWRFLRTHHADIELYQEDGSHPSLAGSYAAACAFYTMIFRKSPQFITYRPDLEENVASTIRNAVQHVVFDTLSFWLRQVGDTTQTDTTQTDTTQTDTTQVGIRGFDGLGAGCRVYPNPVRDRLTVSLPTGALPMEATLCNAKGCRLRTVPLHLPTTSISFADLPKGIYFLTLASPITRVVKQ